MSDHELKNQLSELRSVKRAPALWREQTRERMLKFAESTANRPYSFSDRVSLHFTQVRLAVAPVPLVTTLAVIVMLGLGQAPLAAAMNSSLPGSSLYPVKRLVERVSLSFHSSPAGQGLAYLGLAQRRLSEATQVTDSVTQAKLLRDYNINLGFAEASFQAAPATSSLAVRYDELAAGLANNLKTLAPRSQQPGQAYPAAVALTDKLSSEALGVLVAVHQSGQNNGLLPAAVAQRLDAQIAKVESQLSGVDGKIVTLPTSKPSPRVVIESQQVVVPVREARQMAKQSLTEAKQLVAKREFGLALEKVQESEDIANKAEAAVDKATAGNAAGQVKGDATSAPATPTGNTEPETKPADSNTNTPAKPAPPEVTPQVQSKK